MSGDPILAALAQLLDGQRRLEEGLTKVEERQERFEERLTRLEEGQTRLRVDLMGRMDRFENRLTTFQDDISVNMAGVNTVFNRLAASRQEGDATFAALQTVIQQVFRLRNELEELKKRPA